MIRSMIAFCALFAAMLVGSKLLHESSPLPAAVPSHDQPASANGRAAEEPEDVRPAAAQGQQVAEPGQPATRPGRFFFVSYGDDDADRDEPGRDAPPKLSKELEDLLRDDPANDDSSKKEADAGTTESKQSVSDDPANDDSKDDDKPIKADESAGPELTPELIELRDKLRECLAYYYFRPENVATRSPWGSMHWMIAYGVDSQLIVGAKRVNAIGYLNYNGVCNGQRLFYTSGGKIQAQVGVGVQGHAGQYLAMLAQSRVKTDYPMLVDGQQFTVADLIEHEKLTCRPGTELTFKLIALSHYLKSDEKWKSNDGQSWDIPRLIKEELAQPINGAACGGTHRMTGFSYAVRKREQRKEPVEGQWQRAKKFIEEFHEYTFKLQNPDASFSTEWFVTRADYGDIGRRLQTTGHITEWLAFSLSKEQLVEPRMVKSVTYLNNLMLENRNEKWSIGPLGHALHALAIYDERIFGGKPGTRAVELAEVRKQKNNVR